jgi:predicted DNA-binding ribbon-helix-helix protein
MKSPVVKRSIVIAGHKTSVSLEDAFWTGLKEIAAERHVTLSDMVAVIDQDRRHGNLSSAIRLFVLDHYRQPRDAARSEGKSAVAGDFRGCRRGPARCAVPRKTRAERHPQNVHRWGFGCHFCVIKKDLNLRS